MMKKWIAVVMVLMMAFSMAPGVAYASDNDDSIFDKTSDWFATMGKSGTDKDAILFQRRSERAAKRLGKAMNAEGKKMGNKMEKMFDS